MSKSDISMEDLIQQLHGSDWTARCDAARLLGQSRDPRAVDALLPDLNDPDWRVRRNAAQALGALRDKRAVEPLIALLKDRTMTVRQRAVVALGRIKDIQAVPALLDTLVEGKHEAYDAAKAIRKFGKKALPEIMKAFEQSQSQELLFMLVELKYEGALDLLLKLLGRNEHAARLLAIRELGKFGNRQAIPHLLAQLHKGDLTLQIEVVTALGRLKATEAIPDLLGLLEDDNLYGPRTGLYRAVTEAVQQFASIATELKNAFPGKYPAMFNMGGAPLNLPQAMGLMGNQSNLLSEALSRLQTGFQKPDNVPGPVADAMNKAMEDIAWKFGVMFADARDAKQEHVRRLIELLKSDLSLQRAAAALSLPWYGDERAFDSLKPVLNDPDEVVRRSAAWATSALQKVISYRDQFGS
jgi:HEAT repeat protein